MKREFSMKLFWIVFLGLILWIPLVLINNLADERRVRRDGIVTQLGRVWGGAQLISAPILSARPLPVAGNEVHFSSEVNVKAIQVAEIRKKGTYKIPFYNLELQLSGKIKFSGQEREPQYFILPTANHSKINIVSIKVNGNYLQQVKNDSRFISFLFSPEKKEQEIEYEVKLKLTGMEKFHFLPLAGKIHLEIESNWADPSFTGIYMPDERAIDSKGFSAVWNIKSQDDLGKKIHLFNMMEESAEFVNLQDEIFGVSLILAVDSYHNINRVVKYGFLFIWLTFAAFFIFEVIYSLRVHLIQYVFIGFALLLFYLLLLSFSEYIGFAPAYFIAVLAVVGQIYGYTKVVLKSKNRAFVLGTGISVLYGFLYILINLEEYSLVTGSLALFLLLSAVMYFTRNLDWHLLFGNSEKE